MVLSVVLAGVALFFAILLDVSERTDRWSVDEKRAMLGGLRRSRSK